MKRKLFQQSIIATILVIIVFLGFLNRSKFFSKADTASFNNPNYDVIVAGGGTGGVAAGIQAARMGARTLIIEETDWLGGMYTAAGISAFDGPLNQNLSSGIFFEIEKKIHKYYCPNDPFPCEKLNQGSVARTAFEPSVAKQILEKMVAAEKNLTVKYNITVMEVLKDNKTNKVTGIQAKDQNSHNKKKYYSKVLIDGTEYGDIIKIAGADYQLGRESYSQTQEPHALGGPENEETGYDPIHLADNLIQPLTYSVTVKNTDQSQPAIPPTDYDPNRYETAWDYYDEYVPDGFQFIEGWSDNLSTEFKDGFIQYGWIPDSSKSDPISGDNSFFLNFPNYGNDLVSDYIEKTSEERQEIFQQAKNHSLGYWYYIKQNTPEADNWTIDTEEYNTSDNLPLIPYVRESRRLEAVEILKEQDLSKDLNPNRGVFKSNSITCGDYPMDLHSVKNDEGRDNTSQLNKSHLSIPTSPFQVPYQSLVPKEVDGLLAAEKSIGVTHIANGATRLHPTVTSIGQAAGAAAALSAKYNIPLRDLNVDLLQDVLLDNDLTLFYFKDIDPKSDSFKEIETIALKEITKGYEDLTFQPNASASRVALAIFLVRTLGLTINTNGGPHFADVHSDTFGYAEIETLYNNNLTDPFKYGIPYGYFYPNLTANRATTVASIVNSWQLDLINPATPSFPDISPSLWAYKEIETALARGLIVKENYFRPTSLTNRQFIAEVLYRVTQRLDYGKYEMSYKDEKTGAKKEIHIIVWKTGLVGQQNLKIVEKIPEGSSYLSSSPEGYFDGENIVWELGHQDANSRGSVQYSVKYKKNQ